MLIAVIGTSGQLGFDLARLLPARNHRVLALRGREDLDICDAGAVARMLDGQRPDAVINTAAFHNVDLCEKEHDAAYRTNVMAVREMAKLCESRGITFVQIGTDYVAEGWPANQPVAESAAVHPNSIYSLTRYGGDCMTLAHAPTFGYVVRSCGLFGIAGCKLKGGLNFVDTMVKMAREGKKLRVVDDQIVAPTPTDDLGAATGHDPGGGPGKMSAWPLSRSRAWRNELVQLREDRAGIGKNTAHNRAGAQQRVCRPGQAPAVFRARQCQIAGAGAGPHAELARRSGALRGGKAPALEAWQ